MQFSSRPRPVKLSPGQEPIPFFESASTSLDPDASETLFIAIHMRKAVAALGQLSSAESITQDSEIQTRLYERYEKNPKDADKVIMISKHMSNRANKHGYWNRAEKGWLTAQTGSVGLAGLVLLDGPLTTNPHYMDEWKKFTDDMAGPNGAQNRIRYYNQVDKQIHILQKLVDQPPASTHNVYAASA